MKLYYTPGACSLAVHVALREAGLEFGLERVDLAAKQLARGGDFLAVNPRGYVPVLELADGSRHTEAVALLQYVAEIAEPGALLGATGSRERFAALQWLAFATSELHGRLGKLWHGNLPEPMAVRYRELVLSRIGDLDAQLARTPWLAGDRFSVADAYAFTLLGWCRFIAMDLGGFSSIGPWLGRVAARPAVQAALRAEGLLPA